MFKFSGRILEDMKPLLLILLLAVTVSAQSTKEGKQITNWTPVGVSPNISTRAAGAPDLDPRMSVEGTGKAEMSFANVKRSGDTFKGWVRFVFPSSAIVLQGKWNEVRFYVVCDCRKNEIKTLSGIAYGLDGTVRAEETKQVLDTVPGSIGRELFEFFCERGGPPLIAPTLKPK